MRGARGVLAAGWLLLGAQVAVAVVSEWSPPGALSDPDFAAGFAASERGDWAGAIASMRIVIERRPWDDDAHNLLGFAYRKQGDYDNALAHYRKALELNPYHRGALEYLGEAYVELGRLAEARALLDRLALVCRRVAADPSDWRAECEEWRELEAAIERGRAPE